MRAAVSAAAFCVLRFGSVVLLTALFFVCGNALANPDFETMTTYYDTSGNVIGWYHARCNPAFSTSRRIVTLASAYPTRRK